MPYIYYFDYCGWPARVVFDDDGKTVIQSEVWDPKNCKLIPDQTMNFTYGFLHIDRQHGIKDDDVKGKIESEVGIRPAFALEAFSNLEDDVKQSIARIEASPFIPNKTSVRGFVYDVKSGRLNEVHAKAGVR